MAKFANKRRTKRAAVKRKVAAKKELVYENLEILKEGLVGKVVSGPSVLVCKDPKKLALSTMSGNHTGWTATTSCNGNVSSKGYKHLFACIGQNAKMKENFLEWAEFIRKCGFGTIETKEINKSLFIHYEDDNDLSRKAKWQVLRYALPNESGFSQIKDEAERLYKETDLPALKCLQLAHFTLTITTHSGSRGVWGKNGNVYYIPRVSKRSEIEPLLMKSDNNINESLGSPISAEMGNKLVRNITTVKRSARDKYRLLLSFRIPDDIIEEHKNALYTATLIGKEIKTVGSVGVGYLIKGRSIVLKCKETNGSFKENSWYCLQCRVKQSSDSFCMCSSPCNSGINCLSSRGGRPPESEEEFLGLFYKNKPVNEKLFINGEILVGS